MTFGRTICKHFHSPIYGGSKKKVEGLLINEFKNHESIDYSWMYTKVTGISIQEMDNTY